MAKSKGLSLGRRGFLRGAVTGAVTGAAALVVPPGDAVEAKPQTPAAAETTAPQPPDVMVTDRPGSDFMVDVLKSLDFEYVAANPGSSFRSLQESFVNYNGNKNPEWLTCLHEESSVFMATGYAKTEGKPLLVAAHGTVGLQHAAGAIYDAFCAQSPVVIVIGNTLDVPSRRPFIDWLHSAQDAAAMVRDYTKWDDCPISLTHFAESAVRAYKIAMTPPMGPVVLVADVDLQENPVSDAARANLRVPKLTLARPPVGDSGSVGELARLLVAAENPVLMSGYAIRTADGMELLVELAETLQAPVVGSKFPSHHPLSGGRNLIGAADLIVGLEVADFWGALNDYQDQLVRTSAPIVKKDAKLVTITANDLYLKSNYQNFCRYTEVDMAIAADADATLPSLVEAVKRLVTPERQRVFDDRGKRLGAAKQRSLEQARLNASYGWDASPISTSRLHAEVWNAIKDKDWASVGGSVSPLWNVDKHYQTLLGGMSVCMGFTLPRSVGAALAHRKHGRLAVSLQPDGDFSYVPGPLWTAAHHRIPLLIVMYNNRAYHQERMHVQVMANRHERGIGNSSIGTALEDPNIDYALIARGHGVHGEGPISDPTDLGPVLKRAVDMVSRGEPVLVDVVTQPR